MSHTKWGPLKPETIKTSDFAHMHIYYWNRACEFALNALVLPERQKRARHNAMFIYSHPKTRFLFQHNGEVLVGIKKSTYKNACHICHIYIYIRRVICHDTKSPFERGICQRSFTTIICILLCTNTYRPFYSVWVLWFGKNRTRASKFGLWKSPFVVNFLL